MTEPPADDLIVLQGAWEQIDLEIDGVKVPRDDLSPIGGVTYFKGNRFTVRAADGTVLIEGTFDLDASATPKEIDYIDSFGPDAGRRLPAIYKVEDDILTFIVADEGMPRPSVFRTESGQVMRTFMRRS